MTFYISSFSSEGVFFLSWKVTWSIILTLE